MVSIMNHVSPFQHSEIFQWESYENFSLSNSIKEEEEG